MHRTTIAFPQNLIRKAKLKAASQGISVSEVLRKLLVRWVDDEIPLESERPRKALAERALGSFGMWRDRDADDYLQESRSGLARRDAELTDAQLDA